MQRKTPLMLKWEGNSLYTPHGKCQKLLGCVIEQGFSLKTFAVYYRGLQIDTKTTIESARERLEQHVRGKAA